MGLQSQVPPRKIITHTHDKDAFVTIKGILAHGIRFENQDIYSSNKLEQ